MCVDSDSTTSGCPLQTDFGLILYILMVNHTDDAWEAQPPRVPQQLGVANSIQMGDT
jgi:hypothetical protein